MSSSNQQFQNIGNHTTKQRYLGWCELEICSYHGAQVRKLCCGWLYPGAGTLPPHLHCLYHAGFTSHALLDLMGATKMSTWSILHCKYHYREEIPASFTCLSSKRWYIINIFNMYNCISLSGQQMPNHEIRDIKSFTASVRISMERCSLQGSL